jgi:hypothetical protein
MHIYNFRISGVQPPETTSLPNCVDFGIYAIFRKANSVGTLRNNLPVPKKLGFSFWQHYNPTDAHLQPPI